jgi:hypothetical protein
MNRYEDSNLRRANFRKFSNSILAAALLLAVTLGCSQTGDEPQPSDQNSAANVGGVVTNSSTINKVPQNAGTTAPVAPASDNFANGTFKGYARNRTTKQRADLTLALTRNGNDVTGSVFIGPPLRGSGTVTGRVIGGENVEMTLTSQDVRQKWTIDISAVKTPEGGMEGDYTISNGQRGIFSVSPQK